MTCSRSSPSCSVANASLPVPRANITRPVTETTSLVSSPSARASPRRARHGPGPASACAAPGPGTPRPPRRGSVSRLAARTATCSSACPSSVDGTRPVSTSDPGGAPGRLPGAAGPLQGGGVGLLWHGRGRGVAHRSRIGSAAASADPPRGRTDGLRASWPSGRHRGEPTVTDGRLAGPRAHVTFLGHTATNRTHGPRYGDDGRDANGEGTSVHDKGVPTPRAYSCDVAVQRVGTQVVVRLYGVLDDRAAPRLSAGDGRGRAMVLSRVVVDLDEVDADRGGGPGLHRRAAPPLEGPPAQHPEPAARPDPPDGGRTARRLTRRADRAAPQTEPPRRLSRRAGRVSPPSPDRRPAAARSA